ncbi:MAG: NfeD family protein [Clostridia bacterium]|nr:NfeD family protein [Clostridia bacterium]
MDKIEIFWLAATILLFVVEAVTVNLVSVWFALGTLAALIAALLGAQLWLQIVIFFAVTILTLIATRPLVKKFFNKQHHEPTNADMLIGKICIVTQDIDNIAATGEASCSGKIWTARSFTGDIIKKGSKAKVHSIEGVKLIVEEITEAE